MDDIRQYLHAHRAEIIEQLIGWARIRSVAGVPDHDIELRRSAQWLASAFRAAGFPTVELWPTEGGPAVYAEWCRAPGAPTVLVYSHHDVRAAKDELWEQTPPFEPAERDGRLYGRGTSDAKGQVLAHLWGLRAQLAHGPDHPAVNIKFLVEAEEEIGSPHLADLLSQHRDRLAADLAMVSDTMLWVAGTPAVCTGVRGLLQAELEILGPLTDIHSGAVSGTAPNPIIELGRLIGRLHDDRGRVAIPGFYDTVREPSSDERRELAELPWDEHVWLEQTRTRSVGGEAEWTPIERMYLRPSAEVLAVVGGDPVGPSRGVIPSMATATVQFHLVADQDPAQLSRLLREWVGGEVDPHYDWRLSIAESVAQRPYTTPEDHPAVAALGEAMRLGFDREVGRMRNAGGSPAALLNDELGAPVLFFGTGLPEDRWHDSDESVRLDVLLDGAASLAHFWLRLAS